MAKGATNNYFGIDTTNLELLSEDESASSQSVNMTDEVGDIVIEETYAERNNPKNSFSLLDDIDVAALFILGTLTDGSADPDKVLTSFDIKTSAGSAPSIDVGGEEVITGSAQGRTYTTPAFTLLQRHKAQILFNAFTQTGTGVHLQECSASGKVNLTRSPDAEGKAWDLSGGRIEVQASFKRKASDAIVFAAAADWVITSPLSLSGSDKDYETYTVTLAYNIAGVEPA